MEERLLSAKAEPVRRMRVHEEMERIQGLIRAGVSGLVLLLALRTAVAQSAQTSSGAAALTENSSGTSLPGTIAGTISDTE